MSAVDYYNMYNYSDCLVFFTLNLWKNNIFILKKQEDKYISLILLAH